MKRILITNNVLVDLLASCSNGEDSMLSKPQSVVESVQVDQPSNEIIQCLKDDELLEYKPFSGVDLDAVTESPGVSSDDLLAVIEANSTQVKIDLAAAATPLGIDETALGGALGGAGFGSGKGRGNLPPHAINCAAVATHLNLSEEDVCNAIENLIDDTGRQNFNQAVLELGIDAKDLMETLDMNGHGMEGPAK